MVMCMQGDFAFILILEDLLLNGMELAGCNWVLTVMRFMIINGPAEYMRWH